MINASDSIGHQPAEPSDAERVPGEPGLWVFVFGDMIIFGIMFNTFLYYRGAQVAVFSSAQIMLNRDIGAINTLVLLCSSWLVASAVYLARAGNGARVRQLVLYAMACGGLFVALKLYEYGDKFGNGIGPATNDFFMFYFVMTGLHLIHVLLGLTLLAIAWFRLKQDGVSQDSLVFLECSAIIWHLVDLLWIIMFPTLYLVA